MLIKDKKLHTAYNTDKIIQLRLISKVNPENAQKLKQEKMPVTRMYTALPPAPRSERVILQALFKTSEPSVTPNMERSNKNTIISTPALDNYF